MELTNIEKYKLKRLEEFFEQIKEKFLSDSKFRNEDITYEYRFKGGDTILKLEWYKDETETL